MITLTEEIIRNGTKTNSMYETNTVRGRATKKDMEIYLAKESASIKTKVKPNAMKIRKFDKIDLNSINPVKVI